MTDQQLPPDAPAQQPTVPVQWGGVTQAEPEGPATFVQPAPPKPSLRDRHVLRAVARWTLVTLVLGGLGAGSAYAITSMERTDVPGLATKDDGRWDYPRLKLPALPAAAPRPFSDANQGGIHHAALTDLLLPAPKGAKGDSGAKEVKAVDFVNLYAKDERGDMSAALRDYGVRQIVARSWTAPDGTESRIHLLRFPSVGYADRFLDERLDLGAEAGSTPADVPEAELDESWDNPDIGVDVRQYVYGDSGGRLAYLAAGDTLAVIVQSNKDGAERIPFHQTVVLQTQLLN